jgi:hypothetical protein
LCASLTAGPCFIAALCFYRAGFFYQEIIKENQKETDAVLEKASEYNIDLRSQSFDTIETMFKFNNRPLSNSVRYETPRREAKERDPTQIMHNDDEIDVFENIEEYR